MKTFGLLFGVFAIAVAAIIAGHYADHKQLGMYPPGNDNPATRSRQAQGMAGPQSAQSRSAQNRSAPLTNGQTGTMPEVGTSFGGGSQVSLAGCLVRQSGQWVLQQQESNQEYQLAGELAGLQPNEGRWVELAGHAKEEMPQGDSHNFPAVFVVQKLQQVGPECQPTLPRTVAVPGKSGNEGTAVPITTTKSFGQPTSGSLTGTGREQAPGKQVGPAGQQTPPVKQRSMIQGAPPNLEGAGETPFAAERASQAVRTAHAAARAATGKSSGQHGNSQTQSGQSRNQMKTPSQNGGANPNQP